MLPPAAWAKERGIYMNMKLTTRCSLWIAAAVFVSSLGGAALCAQRASLLCNPQIETAASSNPVEPLIRTTQLNGEIILEENGIPTVFHTGFVVQ